MSLRLWYYQHLEDGGEYGVLQAESVATALNGLGARFLEIYGPSVHSVELLECDPHATTAVLPELARMTLDVCTCGRNLTAGALHTSECGVAHPDEDNDNVPEYDEDEDPVAFVDTAEFDEPDDFTDGSWHLYGSVPFVEDLTRICSLVGSYCYETAEADDVVYVRRVD